MAAERDRMGFFLVAFRPDVKFDQTSAITILTTEAAMPPAADARKPTNSAASTPVQARDLVRRFGGLRAVDGMSIALQRGEMLGLIGPNGAGKTTLFNLIAGSLKPTSGSIRISGEEVSAEGPERRTCPRCQTNPSPVQLDSTAPGA